MLHLLNLREDECTELYRVFSQDYLLELMVEHMLVLVRPAKWEDPFENFLLTHFESSSPGAEYTRRWHGGQLFAQCWTYLEESDAMWRIYSPDRSGVKIKTSRSKLMRAISDVFGLYSMRDCFIGKVLYLPDTELAKTVTSKGFQRSNESSDTGHARALSLLMKRQEFSHEYEIRVICDAQSPMESISGDLLRVPINVNEFIEELVLDPRLDDDEFDRKIKLYRALGYGGEITRSKLYRISDDLLS